MKASNIEITEKEYLIKLNKEDFDLSFISNLLKRIQAEKFFSPFRNQEEDDDDIISRCGNRECFDHLDDK